MRSLRTSWGSRLVAAVLAISLLPVLLPFQPWAGQAEEASYASWLRAHVQSDVDEAFEEAIQVAEAAEAPSLQSFLMAFLEAHPSPEQLEQIFGEGVTGEVLLRLVHHPVQQLAGNATLPKSMLKAASAVGFSIDRLSTAGLMPAAPAQGALIFASVDISREALSVLTSFRLLSAAEPRGP